MPPSPIEQAAVAASPKMRSRSRSRSRLAARRLSSIGLDDVDHMDSLWGVTLSSSNREFVWNMKLEKEEGVEEDESDRDYIMHTLFLKAATLGAGLAKGEEHVLEIESKDSEGKPVKIPVLNVAAGVNPMVNLNFEFSDSRKVIFRLTQGTGPLHLSGLILQGHPGEFDMHQDSMFTETVTSASENEESDEDFATEEEEESEDEEEEEAKGKKQKAGVKRKTSPAANKGKAKQKAKVEEESEEDDDDDDDEEEMELSISKKKKGKISAGLKVGKSPKKGEKAAKEKKKAAIKQKPKAK